MGELAADLRRGMEAYFAGRLSVRRNLHVGVGFLAATSEPEPGRLRFRTLETPRARVSVLEAGNGEPVLALHGLGGTKASFLPTVSALADDFHLIVADLPGFGDSDKPLRAPYDARFFADTIIDLLDALSLKRVHMIGNSLGARIAMEVAFRYPDRAGRLVLLAPSLAWRRDRPLVPMLRLVPPELGFLQPAPRRVVETVIRRLIPGAAEGWAAVGVDEFLRAYQTRSGRAAFYAAARQIYLEEPHGEEGFWTRLPTLQADTLFVWGRRDRIVPIGFARHVETALPRARHLVLDCGHVPQVEVPDPTHAAVMKFLSERPRPRRRPKFAKAKHTSAPRSARRAATTAS